MVQTQFGNRMRDASRLKAVNIAGFAGGNVAKRTAPRADVAHDHHRRMALRPAFTNIRATRLFADRHQLLVAQNIACAFIAFGCRRAHPDPIGLFRLGIIRLMRLFGVALIGNLKIAHGFFP